MFQSKKGYNICPKRVEQEKTVINRGTFWKSISQRGKLSCVENLEKTWSILPSLSLLWSGEGEGERREGVRVRVRNRYFKVLCCVVLSCLVVSWLVS